MAEILDGEEIEGSEEVLVGNFIGQSVDIDDSVILVGSGDEVDKVEDDFFDAVGLFDGQDEVEAVIAGIVEFRTEGGMGSNTDNHAVG